MSEKKINPTGPIVSGCGCLFAFLPIVFAFLATAPGHNMWSEGDSQSGGTYIWGMMFTLPIGFVAFIVGIVLTFTLKKRVPEENLGTEGQTPGGEDSSAPTIDRTAQRKLAAKQLKIGGGLLIGSVLLNVIGSNSFEGFTLVASYLGSGLSTAGFVLLVIGLIGWLRKS
ncbi:MAG: hypothetical protein RL454_506 [Actinomycetota bacterium]|jgi:hypothetical protein